MPRITPLLLLLLAACASGTSAPPSTSHRPENVRVLTGTGRYEVDLNRTNHASLDRLPIAPDSAWTRLPAVYSGLGLPVGAIDTNARTLGTGTVQVRSRLGRTPLSRFISCGGRMGVENADQYAVTLNVSTTVSPADDGGTRLTSHLEASARPMSIGTTAVRCSSNGTLERWIAERVSGRG